MLSSVIHGHDQFVADYRAVGKYQLPDMYERLELYLSQYVGRLDPMNVKHGSSRIEVPDKTERFGAERSQRDFRFSFRYDPASECFHVSYVGYVDISDGRLVFWDIVWLYWSRFLEDYYDHIGADGDCPGEKQYDVYMQFSRSDCKDGQEEKLIIKTSDGSRHYFYFQFADGDYDNTPFIRYLRHREVKVNVRSVSDVRFDRFWAFEEACAVVLKPDKQPDFMAVKEMLAGSSVETVGESINSSIYMDRRKSNDGNGCRFWFMLSNEAGQSVVKYKNYTKVK